MFEFLSELTERTDSSRSSIGVRSNPPSRAPSPEVRAEIREVLEVRLRERGGVAHRFLGRDGAVRLDREREAIVVRALTDARFGHGEVGAANRIVDRVHANEIDGKTAVERVLIGLDVAAALVHVKVDVEVPIVLQRKEMVRPIDDADSARAADVGRGDRAGFRTRDVENNVLDIVG